MPASYSYLIQLYNGELKETYQLLQKSHVLIRIQYTFSEYVAIVNYSLIPRLLFLLYGGRNVHAPTIPIYSYTVKTVVLYSQLAINKLNSTMHANLFQHSYIIQAHVGLQRTQRVQPHAELSYMKDIIIIIASEYYKIPF